MAFLTQLELEAKGFKSLGKNVLLSDKAQVYGADKIEIGDNTRIDDFCILSAGKGGIKIGQHVHIACFCSLIGNGQITLADFSGISSRVAVYSSNDDYSGNWLTNPTVSDKFTNVTSGDVYIGKHVIVGTGACIMPNITIGDGSAVAALSLVSKNVADSSIVGGTPARFIKKRETKLFELEREFLAEDLG